MANQMETNELATLRNRISKLEQQNLDEFLTLVEIMSNATFFGDLKKTSCKHAKKNQCAFFFLKKEVTESIPTATQCRIRGCSGKDGHYHIEISNLTCTLCPQWQNSKA